MNDTKSNSFVSNVVILLCAQMSVKLLGMLYRMVITNIDGFGDAGNGYYSAGFQIYTLLLAVSSIGIPNAVSKLIAEQTALGRYREADNIFRISLFIFAVLGATLSAGLFFFSSAIARGVLNMEGAKYTLAALSPSIFFVCVSSVLRGYFSGINKMRIMSLSQIIEQVFKSALTILMVLAAVGQAPEIMSAVANFATTLATVVGTIYLVIAYKFKAERNFTPANGELKKSFGAVAKKILMIAIPISLCSIIAAINRIIDTATVVRGIESAFKNYIPARIGAAATVNPTSAQLNAEAVRLAGILSKSDTLLNLPLALNTALATVLVPSISKYSANKNTLAIRNQINSSFLMSIVMVLPCAVGYIILARPIYELIYPNASLGFELLQLGAASLIFTALNQTLTGALQGMGRVYVPAAALAFGCVIKLISNVLLIRIPEINIYGAVIGSALCQAAVFGVEFYCLSRALNGGISIKRFFIKPIICSIVLGAAAYFIYKAAYYATGLNIAAVAASIILSAIIYGTTIILSKVFSDEEILRIPIVGKLYFSLKKHMIFKKNEG